MLSKHGDCLLYFVLFEERQSQWTIIEFKYDFLWPNGNGIFCKLSIRIFGVFTILLLKLKEMMKMVVKQIHFIDRWSRKIN